MWTGNAIIHPGWAVFKGTAGDHSRHKHHAVQIAISPAGLVGAWVDGPGDVSAPALVIAADRSHRIESGPAPLVLLYLERESAAGRTVEALCADGVRLLAPAVRQQLVEHLRDTSKLDAAAIDSAISIIGGSATRAALFADARITRSIDEFPRPLPPKLTLGEVANQAGLSPSRYSHLFQAHTGMAMRPFLRWLRLKEALAKVAQGANLTEAAHAAGFSDSAHLSRIFRRTFGITPKTLLDPSLSIHAPS